MCGWRWGEGLGKETGFDDVPVEPGAEPQTQLETPGPFPGVPPPALCPPPGSACGPGLLPLGLRVKTESIIICKGREGRKEGFCLVKQGERREPKERELGGGK